MEIHAASELMKLVKYDLQSLLMVGMWLGGFQYI